MRLRILTLTISIIFILGGAALHAGPGKLAWQLLKGTAMTLAQEVAVDFIREDLTDQEVASLKERTNDLQQQLHAFNQSGSRPEDFETIEKVVSTMEKVVKSMDARVGTLEERVDSLEYRVEIIENDLPFLKDVISRHQAANGHVGQDGNVAPHVSREAFRTTGFVGHPLPQVWTGTLDQPGYGVYPMILSVEKVRGGVVVGKLNWPSFHNNVTSVAGKIVTRFDDFVEKSKWRIIKDKVNSQRGTWLRFTENRLISGSMAGFQLHGQYYAHVTSDGVMKGGYFSKDSTTLAGEFTIILNGD